MIKEQNETGPSEQSLFVTPLVNADETRDREQAAFEDWLADTCPSGDVTEVQRQWETSSALQNFMEAEADRECDVAFVERGMARLREGLK